MGRLFGLACAAAAALLPLAATAAPTSRWSGLYFGAQAGYGMTNSAETYAGDSYVEWAAVGEGIGGGVFAGYNFLPGGNWVGGVEFEGNLSNLTGQYYNNFYHGPYYTNDWSAAGRVRFGFLSGPDTLLYASLGLAAADFDYSHGQWGLNGYQSTQHVLPGVQVGAGVETFVTPSFSLRAEGVLTQYATGWIDAGDRPYVGVQPTSLVARMGVAYHPGWMGQPESRQREPVRASWNGLYAGADAGVLALGSVEDTNPSSGTPIDPAFETGAASGEIGAHAGFNWQLGAFVAGAEFDGGITHAAIPYSGYGYGEQDWVVAARARLGFLATDNTLLYGTVGFAGGGFDYTSYWGDLPGAVFTGSGLQLGAGAEAFVTPQISARIEGLYTTYGTHTIFSSGQPYWDVSPRTLEARIGISFHPN